MDNIQSFQERLTETNMFLKYLSISFNKLFKYMLELQERTAERIKVSEEFEVSMKAVEELSSHVKAPVSLAEIVKDIERLNKITTKTRMYYKSFKKQTKNNFNLLLDKRKKLNFIRNNC